MISNSLGMFASTLKVVIVIPCYTIFRKELVRIFIYFPKSKGWLKEVNQGNQE